jgi:hypothetical protein
MGHRGKLTKQNSSPLGPQGHRDGAQTASFFSVLNWSKALGIAASPVMLDSIAVGA